MSNWIAIGLAVAVAAGVAVALLASGVGRPATAAASQAGPRSQRWRAAADNELSERMRRRRLRYDQTLAERLAASGVKLRPTEFRAIQAGLALILGGAVELRFSLLLVAVVAAVAGWLAPQLFLQFRRGYVRQLMSRQLPEALITLSNSLKAGLNLPQALDAVARSGYHPLSDEFGRVVREMAMGATVEQAMTNLVRRAQNEDLELAVTAILIHNTIGGNLATVLDGIERTIRTRSAINSELATLTAQTRASALVITLLPFGVGLLLLFVAPSYFGPMLANDAGRLVLLACGASILVGNVLIRRAIRIDV